MKLKVILGGIFYWLDKIVPWFFLACLFLIVYNGAHEGFKDWKDTLIFSLLCLLLFRRSK